MVNAFMKRELSRAPVARQDDWILPVTLWFAGYVEREVEQGEMSVFGHAKSVPRNESQG